VGREVHGMMWCGRCYDVAGCMTQRHWHVVVLATGRSEPRNTLLTATTVSRLHVNYCLRRSLALRLRNISVPFRFNPTTRVLRSFLGYHLNVGADEFAPASWCGITSQQLHQREGGCETLE
jgi:hypothetical protein